MPVKRSGLRTKMVLGGAIAALAMGVVVSDEAQPLARRVIAVAAGGGAGTVNLPYSTTDGQGNNWIVHNYGQLQQQGNNPVYSQGAMLQINGAYAQMVGGNRGAKLDGKTGELILENMNVNNVAGLKLTRRILFNKEEGYVRYIDVLSNTSNQDVTPNLVLNTNLNYGVQAANMVEDPKKKENQIGWVATTHANGRVVGEMYAGKGAKFVPNINYQQGNSNVQVTLSPVVPAGKEIAFMHFHMTTQSVDAATKFITGMRESKIMAEIPTAIRKIIINYRGGDNFIGDYELLRGETLDVVELRTGDQLRGTLKQGSYKLQTFYGPVEVPVDRVIGLINIGEFRPRQLVVTREGEVFGGYLADQKLALELSSGQVTEIPLGQVSRMGYRKRPGEPEEWKFDKPMVLMRTGDRIGIQMPAGEIEVATRYGRLKLPPATVAAATFQSEDHGVHEIALTDGSRFAGLVSADVFEMKLAAEGPEQVVKFPASSIARLQFAPMPEDAVGDEQAVLTLANEDQLVGSLTGKLNLDTAFSTLAIDAAQIKKLTKSPGSPTDVQVVLWDDTTVSGQLQESEITCQLRSGATMKVPVALVEEYDQPRPQASAGAVEMIRQLVNQLASPEVQQREFAEERLVNMGPAIAETLKGIRAQAPPEVQQKIDGILKQTGALPNTPGSTPETAPDAPAPQPGS